MNRTPWPRPLAYMLGFALGGPPVGYVMLGLPAGLAGVVGVVALQGVFGFPILVAYIVGVVPAALTGLAVGWSLRWGKPWLSLLLAPAAGAVSTLAWSAMLGGAGSLGVHSMAAALGGGAALVCTLFAFGRSRVRLGQPGFTRNWHAGNVLLAVLVVVMAAMIATLLLPASSSLQR